MLEALAKRIPEGLRKLPMAVVMGGRSPEREISLRSGLRVHSALQLLGFNVTATELNEELPSWLREREIQLVFLATHGVPGEDGGVQGLLDNMGIAYTGSGVQGCALAINKAASKSLLAAQGINTPAWMLCDEKLPLEEQVHLAASTVGFPLILKPVFGGSSLGIRYTKNVAQLRTSLQQLYPEHTPLLAERYIEGREVTVSILEDWNGRPYCLPILELQPRNFFYDYECKTEAHKTDFLVPAELSTEIGEKLRKLSLKSHAALYQRDLSRSDFIVDSDGECWYLESNSIPGLTELSDLPAQAKAYGMGFEEVVIEILLCAWSRCRTLNSANL